MFSWLEPTQVTNMCDVCAIVPFSTRIQSFFVDVSQLEALVPVGSVAVTLSSHC